MRTYVYFGSVRGKVIRGTVTAADAFDARSMVHQRYRNVVNLRVISL
jgi:hypothetical protein